MRLLALLLSAVCAAAAYPLDGAEATGIRRLEGYRLAAEGKINRRILLRPGSYLPSAEIKLRLQGANEEFDLGPATPRDPELQAGLEKILAARDPSYSIALLDISYPLEPRFAAVRPEVKRIPGSLGKLLVATGLFDALRLRLPQDVDARRRFLRDTAITADAFVHTDGKTAPFYDSETKTLTNRRIETGDVLSLYEWLDHMLSQSSNAAASLVWKEALLLRRFGAEYPLTAAEQAKFLSDTPKTELRALALETLESPLRAAGIDTSNLRLGTFFTRNASARIPGAASYGSPWERCAG